MTDKSKNSIRSPAGYDAVGAYVWQVELSGGTRCLVLTNDPVPDRDFKYVVDFHRRKVSKMDGVPLDSVHAVNVGYAVGVEERVPIK